jgi:hypothetical protein
MKQLSLILIFLSGYILTFAQKDTTSLCAVLEDQPFNRVDEDYQNPINVYWKDIKTIVHVHYSIYDSWAEIPEEHVYNAIDDLNEQFEEYMFNFDLIQIRYHDMIDGNEDGFELATGAKCFPYSTSSMVGYIGNKAWDVEEFMNIHVVPRMCGTILGFAYRYPAYYNVADGVWVETSVFGMDGDYLFLNRDENKTLVHEVGHYLGLHHVFNGVDFCGEDVEEDCTQVHDDICDTPPTKVNFSCVNPVCSNFNPERPWADYIHNNHMDYYIDSCRTAFTDGQLNYMHNHMVYNRPTIIDEEDITCFGDINGDYVVGTNDLMSILACWEEEPVGDCELCDLTQDGIIGASDILFLNTVYGNQCAGPMWYYIEEQPAIGPREINIDRRWRDVMNNIYKQ